MASATSQKKTNDPTKDKIIAAVISWQNPPNNSQTLFHRACELPYWPKTPTAIAAPLEENSNPIMVMSRMTRAIAAFSLEVRTAIDATSDAAAYKDATAFDIRKYLTARIWSNQAYDSSRNEIIMM